MEHAAKMQHGLQSLNISDRIEVFRGSLCGGQPLHPWYESGPQGVPCLVLIAPTNEIMFTSYGFCIRI